DPARERDVVVLDQDAVVEGHPVVGAAARTDGVLLDGPQRGRRLAGVEDRDAPGSRVHVPACECGNAAEALHEVERGALGDQQRRRAAVHLGHQGAGVAEIAILPVASHDDSGIELEERFLGDVQPRHDATLLREQPAAGALLLVHRRPRRDVAPAPVLGQCAPHELAVDGLLQRLEGRCHEAAPPSLADAVAAGLASSSPSVTSTSRASASATSTCCTTPDATTSACPAANAARSAAGARTTSDATGVRNGLRASDLVRRTSPSTQVAASSARTAPGSAASMTSRISALVGHDARCTEPSCHHDQTSSVAYGRYGANRRSRVFSVTSIAALAEAAPAASRSP